MERIRNLLSVVAIVSIIAIGLTTNPTNVSATGPFGGAVVFLFPCTAMGPTLKVTISPPTPGNYMYMPGSFSYLFGPPRHTGQWLLGMSGPPIPCLFHCGPSICTNGSGDLIIYHGSSV